MPSPTGAGRSTAHPGEVRAVVPFATLCFTTSYPPGRIGSELPRYLEEGRDPFADWFNGAYVLESLPCALWCFLASPEDFEQTLFTAVDAGHDAGTVAAMACTVAGAYLGPARLPTRLVADLEYHDRLLGLADGLHELNRRLTGSC